MSALSPLLTVSELTKDYALIRDRLFGTRHLRALDRVSLALSLGETLGLVGESGSGKTTLARCILRLTEPTSGQVLLDGEDVLLAKGKALQSLRRKMQMVFQDPGSSLNPRKTLAATVGDPLLVHGLAKKNEVEERVALLFERVGLEGVSPARFPSELSGGQRQRVAIARALATQPKLLVADEPVTSLDVSVQAQIINLLEEVTADELACLFISHDLSVVRYVADRVAVMYFGQLVEVAPVDALFQNPRHPYTQLLLDAVEMDRGGSRMNAGEPPSRTNPPKGCPFHPRCPEAKPECSNSRPPERSEDGHLVRCIL